MARRASEVASGAGWEMSFSVPSDAFWRPPRASWPHSPTPLEVLAVRAGLTDDELRDVLRAEVDRRSRDRAARHASAHKGLDRRLGR